MCNGNYMSVVKCLFLFLLFVFCIFFSNKDFLTTLSFMFSGGFFLGGGFVLFFSPLTVLG